RAVPSDALQQDEEARHQRSACCPPCRGSSWRPRRELVSHPPTFSMRVGLGARVAPETFGSEESARRRGRNLTRTSAEHAMEDVALVLEGLGPQAFEGGHVNQSRVMVTGAVVGAVVGAAVSYLFFTDAGKHIRDRFEPAVDDLRQEFTRFQRTVRKVGDMAYEGLRVVDEFNMAAR